ncbi:hypothetical protein SAMN05421819_2474 [Bryocella elongata]|uniref:Uncharacterized protein n=1 Tax=Bryocella elongata TaxID=863522 RepID=A0A1H5Z7U8_9BACT|nr:hypothetical protein SAMN05421819_2474 [Bryocella elongata]
MFHLGRILATKTVSGAEARNPAAQVNEARISAGLIPLLAFERKLYSVIPGCTDSGACTLTPCCEVFTFSRSMVLGLRFPVAAMKVTR